MARVRRTNVQTFAIAITMDSMKNGQEKYTSCVDKEENKKKLLKKRNLMKRLNDVTNICSLLMGQFLLFVLFLR